MRISFGGSLLLLKPVVLVYTANDTFSKLAYVNAGYTNFEVMCIGGGGGRGGNYHGLDFNHATETLRSFGGQGGGGGSHHIRGVLSDLPDPVDIVVGAAGSAGTDLLTDSGDDSDIDTTDGTDGGYSSFNEPACLASGGNGGKRVYSATRDISPNCDGGDGGLGGITEAGWGGKGGVAGTEPDLGPEPGTPGESGPLLKGPFEYTSGFFTAAGLIGKGGGGGAGGVGIEITGPEYTIEIEATPGGRGSYSPSDQSVYGPGGPVVLDAGLLINPGFGGGARITPLNGSNHAYGQAGVAGVVAIRLTVE